MTEIVAHRGACLVAPENTFSAADAAIARGASYVEFDVRRTADGVHVVMHDRDVARTTDGAGAVDELTSAEIAKLDAGAWFGDAFRGEPVPRLADYLAHLKGRCRAYCEVKRGDIGAIVAAVRDAGMEDDTFFFSFKPELRAALIEAAPDARHNLPLDEVGSVAAAQAMAQRAIIEFTLDNVSEEGMYEARAAGFETMIFEPAADPQRLDLLVQQAPDLFNIDAVDEVATRLGTYEATAGEPLANDREAWPR